MIKLSANVSKKVPMPEIQFSSRCCSAGIEVELSSATDSKKVLAKLKRLYATLEEAVDEQLRGPRHASGPCPGPAESPSPDPVLHDGRQAENGSGRSGPRCCENGNGNGKGRPATDAQVRAIAAIASDLGIDDDGLCELLGDRYAVNQPNELTVGEASSLIDELKDNG